MSPLAFRVGDMLPRVCSLHLPLFRRLIEEPAANKGPLIRFRHEFEKIWTFPCITVTASSRRSATPR